jgi:phosphatidylserine decarboxylase
MADACMLIGSFVDVSNLFLKEKFFDLRELLGEDKGDWLKAFADGDYAIFRLTPEKYHYNHVPVSGVVRDFYRIDGANHSCNPAALVEIAAPLSKNRRFVSIIDTDVDGGAGAGLVAMIEITALMIGRVDQCYSEEKYDNPQPMRTGLFLKRGCPKSLYRPGSSTDVLLFQRKRVRLDADLILNQTTPNFPSRFSSGFGKPLAETEVIARSQIARVM